MIPFVSVVFVLSCAAGVGNWILVQGHKTGTILPIGHVARPGGQILGLLLSWGSYIGAFAYCFGFAWWAAVIASLSVWLASRVIAGLIERALFQNEENYTLIIFTAKDLASFSASAESAREHLAEQVPDWWLGLMGRKCREKLLIELHDIFEGRGAPNKMFEADA